MKPLYFILIILVFDSITGIAQDTIVDQDVKVNQQIWLDYNTRNHLDFINSEHNLSTQFGFRKITPEIYNRFLVISTLNLTDPKKLIKIFSEEPFVKSYQLGAGLIYTQNYDRDDNFELRVIQGFKFDIPTIKPITLRNFVRLEERFQNSFDNSGWTSGFRLRYRMSTILSWNRHLLNVTKGLYFPLEAEVFFNLKKTDRFNDLVRLSPGIGYKLDNDWRFELYLIFNRTKNITETNNKSNDFIVRLRVYQGRTKKQSSTINEIDD